ncbi:MAG: hypothetical protein ACRC5A_15775 [Enterobacteriaceae bacterium]
MVDPKDPTYKAGLAEQEKELSPALQRIKNAVINLFNFLSGGKLAEKKALKEVIVSHFAEELATKIVDARPDPDTGRRCVKLYVCDRLVYLEEDASGLMELTTRDGKEKPVAIGHIQYDDMKHAILTNAVLSKVINPGHYQWEVPDEPLYVNVEDLKNDAFTEDEAYFTAAATTPAKVETPKSAPGDEKARNRAAVMIQNAFRKHQEYQNQLIQQAQDKGLAYARKKYQGSNLAALNGPTEFWVNTQKLGPVLHTPVTPPDEPASGAFKALATQDKSFVALVPVGDDTDFSKEATVDDSDLDRLNLPTVKYGAVVNKSKTLMIAPNAGTPLSDKTISADAFRRALSDLETLHENRIFLRDIKPDNLAVQTLKDGQVQVNFIDVDGRHHPDSGENIKPLFTLGYITPPLLGALYPKAYPLYICRYLSS